MRRWLVVLVSPKEDGNVGAAARVIRNFGAGGLRVVDPRCEVNGVDARRFSSGAAALLRSAEIFPTLKEALADRQLSIGLTGVCGKHHRTDCGSLVPRPLLEGKNVYTRCALVFGREERGMLGEELESCDFLWTLPTNPDFPSLNLSQAIGIALAGVAEAERSLGLSEAGLGLAPTGQGLTPLGGSDAPEDAPATNHELEILSDHLRKLVNRCGWPEDRRVTNTLTRIRNLFQRGNITKREVNLFHGICKQALYTIEHGTDRQTQKNDDEN